jgi:hypothetical protein
MSLVEVLVTLSILTIVIITTVYFITTMQTSVIMNQDRAFAIQKAMALVNELRAYAQANESSGGTSTLDIFDDGVSTSPLLTISQAVFDPAHLLSGNSWLGTRWRYARRISVRKFASFEASNVRIVDVKIFLTQSGQTDASLMAEISSVVTTIGDTAPPKQVYDIYLLCLENIPGWWVYLAYLKPFIETALSDMEMRNPGIEFRQHWITKAAYGRDQEYKPYFNNAVDSTQDINYVYFYPGSMPSGSAVSQYYVPANVLARVNIDNTTANDYHSTNNRYPYTLADQYNHAMRYPNELALYQNRLANGTEKQGVLTYRLLLDDMILNPQKYRNALFINLHGELIPMPSLRNYSDAAKDPAIYPQWRAVTHPEKLRSGLAEDIKLRVYAYLSDPSIAGNNYMTVPISIVIPEVNLTGAVTIAAIKGGITGIDPPITYMLSSPAPNSDGGVTGRMYATVTYEPAEDRSVIRLYNTPLRTPETSDNRGLDTTRRLYGMDYIPCPVSGTDFGLNLTSTLADKPKNTGRWIITISQSAVSAMSLVRIDTRINDDLTTGTMWPSKNKPTNLSTTYIWRSDSSASVPFSERYQFQGDPRHCPYADVKSAHGYNWYFDNLRDATNVINEWPGFDATRLNNGTSVSADGWHGSGGTSGDMLEIDVPRFFLLLRTALTGANNVFTTITGFSFYYMGLGNEIGYDAANGFPNSIPVSKKPFDGSSGSRNEQSITTDQTGGVKYIRENVSSYWWGMPWLGENYPDGVYTSQWSVNGNLNSGSGANTFVRIRRADIITSGTAPLAKSGTLPLGTTYKKTGSGSYTINCVRRTLTYGCTSFYNIGTTSSTFRHNFPTADKGTITVSGTAMANSYNFPLFSTADITRPFALNYNWGAVPTEFSLDDYSSIRCSASVMSRFYNHNDGASWEGSSLIRLKNLSDSNAFIVVNGLAQTEETGSAFIARYAVISLVHGLLTAGLPGTPSRIVQLPRLEIKQPNVTTELDNPVTIPIIWSTEWKRWDKQKYTSAYPSYPDDFAETESDLRYALLYSRDNGKTWLHILDESSATAGVPDQSKWVPDSISNGDESYDWDVSDNFPEGSYIIMIEVYRSNLPNCHYAYHQQKIYINR